MAEVLYIHRGGSAAWTIPITNADGSACDLTGVTDLSFLAKRRIDDDDGDAVLTLTPNGSTRPPSAGSGKLVVKADVVQATP